MPKPAGAPQAAKGDGGVGTADGRRRGQRQRRLERPRASTTPDATTTPAEPEAPTQTTADTGGGGGGATDGYALNDEGFDLVNQGRYEEAIPVLQKAVDTLRSSGDEQTYNYALFNLGSAYVGAGRYDEAIPVLQERMQFDDGQLGTVQRTLDEALAGAGQARAGGTSKPKPPKEPKPGQSGAAWADRRGAPRTPGRGRLAAAELRRALLGEGDHALDEVAGAPLLALRRGLGLELLAQIGVERCG